MKNNLLNAAAILNSCVYGFHQYILGERVGLSFVSDSLCAATGYERDELLSESEDLYAKMVHPADIGIYNDFIAALKEEAQTLTCEYRLVKKSGETIYVSDRATSEALEDGTMVCSSTLTDISGIKSENGNLQFLNETIPCGFLNYTCEKQPKITYINKQMKDFLRFPRQKDGELDYFEMYKENIFLAIPVEERRKFMLYLNRVYNEGITLAGELALQRCDGTRAYVFGWITKVTNAQGVEEFQSVCMDITERHRARKDNERRQYIKALGDIYDKIFEFDLSTGTVKCLRSNNSPMFKWVENIPMQMEEAAEKWITDTVIDEDRDRVIGFFHQMFQKKLSDENGKPPQITYKANSTSGDIKNYRGVMIKIDDMVGLYCMRCISDLDVENIRQENTGLKENLQEILTRFTDGIAAFVVQDGLVRPLYAGENVCAFFGYTNEEWMGLMKKNTPLKDFVANSDIEYSDFADLLRNGEGEFIYYDLKTKSERRIRAICSRKTAAESVPQYIMLYKEGEVTQNQTDPLQKREVVIRTFGYFDVFVNGKAIAFRNKKSKELFALLVDRRGGYVTSEEAIGYLWEDESANPVTLARYRKVALRLKNILEEYGIVDVVETVEGKRRIVTENVKCDLYDYLSGKDEYLQLFKGSYLTNYSWAENTLAELSKNIYN